MKHKHTGRGIGVMATVLALCVAGGSAMAADRDRDPDLLGLTVGYFDILHNDDAAAEFRVEYRPSFNMWVMKPFVGGMATTDGAVHGYAGILFDVPFGRFRFTPSFAPGYFYEGNGKDLGHRIEFRSQMEIGYVLPNGGRVAVNFNHISNAGIGTNNPGSESLGLTYAVPLDLLTGF